MTPPTRSSPAAENLMSPTNSRRPRWLSRVRDTTPVREAVASSIPGPVKSFGWLPKAISWTTTAVCQVSHSRLISR